MTNSQNQGVKDLSEKMAQHVSQKSVNKKVKSVTSIPSYQLSNLEFNLDNFMFQGEEYSLNLKKFIILGAEESSFGDNDVLILRLVRESAFLQYQEKIEDGEIDENAELSTQFAAADFYEIRLSDSQQRNAREFKEAIIKYIDDLDRDAIAANGKFEYSGIYGKIRLGVRFNKATNRNEGLIEGLRITRIDGFKPLD